MPKTMKKKTSKTSAGAARSSARKTAPAKKEVKNTGKKKTAAPSKKVARIPSKKTAAPASPVQTVPPKERQKYSGPRLKGIMEIRSKLIKQKQALLNEAESALNELPGPAIFPDLGDQATAETDRNFMLRLRGREQRLLKKIEEAIDRIETGTFGICDDCGLEIDIKRLEARPVTTMCINCKTLQEEEERLREA